MSIKFTYTAWDKETNFELTAGQYQTLDEFVDLIKNSELRINEKLTQMLEQRGDLVPGMAKHKLHPGQEGNKKLNHGNLEQQNEANQQQ